MVEKDMKQSVKNQFVLFHSNFCAHFYVLQHCLLRCAALCITTLFCEISTNEARGIHQIKIDRDI